MNLKQEHSEYIKTKGEFQISCSLEIFSNDEIKILKKHGHWFQALMDGQLKPFTDLQVRFVEVIKNKHKPFSLEEKAWFKYVGRKKLEKENPSKFNLNYSLEGEFFSREDYYKLHPYKQHKF